MAKEIVVTYYLRGLSFIILLLGVAIGAIYSKEIGTSIFICGFLLAGLYSLMGMLLQKGNEKTKIYVVSSLAFIITIALTILYMLEDSLIVNPWFIYSPFIIVAASFLVIKFTGKKSTSK